MRIVAVFSGLNWNDASVARPVVPVDMNLDKQKDAYETWYKGVYCPSLRSNKGAGDVEFMGFTEWLMDKGAVTADDAVEAYWNY